MFTSKIYKHKTIKYVKFTTNILKKWLYNFLHLVAPRHARIEREWGYFVAGKPYNVTCSVMGSEPSPYIKILLNHKALKKMNVSLNSVSLS